MTIEADSPPELSPNDVEAIIRQASKEEIERLPFISREAPVSTGWIPTEDEGKKRKPRDPNPLGSSYRYGTTKYFRLDSLD